MNIKLLSGATATSAVPTAATDGFSLRPDRSDSTQKLGAGTFSDAVLFLKSTAGSGTMTVTVKLWVYNDFAAAWAPLGTHATDATRGRINEGNAIGEVDTDSLRHTERVNALEHYDRVYAQVTAIGGTATAVDLWLLARNAR